jgi:hypothetical protein
LRTPGTVRTMSASRRLPTARRHRGDVRLHRRVAVGHRNLRIAPRQEDDLRAGPRLAVRTTAVQFARGNHDATNKRTN